MAVELDDTLTTFERAELVMAEDVIRAGLDSFIKVGEALARIRDRRLYRESHRAFAEYCEDQWRLSRRHVDRIIGASDVVDNLRPMGLVHPESERQVRPLTKLEPDQQREAWSRAVETAPEGKVTAKHVEAVVREMTEDDEPLEVESVNQVPAAVAMVPAKPREALHSSASNEWYTPRRYLDAVHEVMGGIDVDPASNALANQTVRAVAFYDQASNGFNKDWTGRVFLNPPYGIEDGESNQARWSARLVEQYKDGITSEAILLVNATTDREWFRPLWDFPICFTDHRIRFYTPEGEGNQPTHGNAFIYLGPNVDRFAETFKQFGVVAQRLA